MLRDEKEVALNEVLNQLKMNRQIAGKMHDMTEDANVASRLSNDLRVYGHTVSALEDGIRSLNYLPVEPDPDRQTAEKLLIKLKSLLADDKEAAILQEAESLQQQLYAAVKEALRHDVGNGLRSILRGLQSELDETDAPSDNAIP